MGPRLTLSLRFGDCAALKLKSSVSVCCPYADYSAVNTNLWKCLLKATVLRSAQVSRQQ